MQVAPFPSYCNKSLLCLEKIFQTLLVSVFHNNIKIMDYNKASSHRTAAAASAFVVVVIVKHGEGAVTVVVVEHELALLSEG